MPLAWCGPAWLYFLFVSNSWCGFVEWFAPIVCCPLVSYLNSGCTLATCCMFNSLPHATGLVWSCWVLPSFCLRHLVCFCALFPLVLSVATCCTLTICHVPNACPLPSALCPLYGPVGCYLRFAQTPVCVVMCCFYVLPSAALCFFYCLPFISAAI